MSSKRTKEELLKLAKDLYHGKIFTSLKFHCENEADIHRSFMCLLFVNDAKFFDNVSFFYEYYDKQMPRSINGNPVFFSCYALRKDEFETFREIYNKLINKNKSMEKEILNE